MKPEDPWLGELAVVLELGELLLIFSRGNSKVYMKCSWAWRILISIPYLESHRRQTGLFVRAFLAWINWHGEEDQAILTVQDTSVCLYAGLNGKVNQVPAFMSLLPDSRCHVASCLMLWPLWLPHYADLHPQTVNNDQPFFLSLRWFCQMFFHSNETMTNIRTQSNSREAVMSLAVVTDLVIAATSSLCGTVMRPKQRNVRSIQVELFVFNTSPCSSWLTHAS